MSSSNSTTSPSTSDNRTLIVGIILGIVAVIIIGVIIFFIARLRPRSRLLPEASRHDASRDRHAEERDSDALPWASTRSLGRDHLATKITPFGKPGGETPRFYHTPGENMRIASRRDDGVWQFGDPRAPFTPSGVSDPSPQPSPASLAPSSAYPWGAKGRDSYGSGFGYGHGLGHSPTGSLGASSLLSSGWKAKEREAFKKQSYDDYNEEDIIPPPAYVYGREWDDQQGGFKPPV